MREARAMQVAELSERHGETNVSVAAQTVTSLAAAPDMTTWSKARRDAYLDSVIDPSVPNTVLRIPSLALEAAGHLQEAGLIRDSRGHITVLDRFGLEARTCECYAVVKPECDRLLPARTAS